MAHDLHQALGIVEPYLAEELVPASELRQIRELTSSLPPAPVAGFECPLSGPPGCVGFSASLPQDSLAFRMVVGDEGASSAATPFELPDAWGFVRDVCLRARASRSESAVWLEFDLDRQDGLSSTPAAFFGLERRRLDVAGGPVLEGLVSSIPDPFVPEGLGETLGDIERCLQPDKRLRTQFGVFPARRTAQGTVRFAIAGLTPAEIPGVLNDAGWRGDPSAWTELIASGTGSVDEFVLTLDVGRGVGDRVGIECSASGPPVPVWNPGWQPFFERLVENGLCDRSRLAALMRWPGHEPVSESRSVGQAASAAHLFRHHARLVLGRGWNHVKISLLPGEAPTAKAYFGFGMAWFGGTTTAVPSSRSATS